MPLSLVRLRGHRAFRRRASVPGAPAGQSPASTRPASGYHAIAGCSQRHAGPHDAATMQTAERPSKPS